MAAGEGDQVSVCHDHPASCYEVVVANAVGAASAWQGRSHFRWFDDEGTWILALLDSGMTIKRPQQPDETPTDALRDAMPDQSLHWIAAEIDRIGVPPREEG